jgi:hypothetical protein
VSRFATLLSLVAVPALLTAAAPSALAQGNSGNTSAAAAVPTVTVIQAEALPAPGGRAVIVRRASGAPREIIVLPAKGATAADLASALSLLAGARARDTGALAAAQERIAISRAEFSLGESAETQRFFDNLLKRLANAPTVDVPGVARGRGIVIPQNRPALD